MQTCRHADMQTYRHADTQAADTQIPDTAPEAVRHVQVAGQEDTPLAIPRDDEWEGRRSRAITAGQETGGTR
jgi:hypothetical protein